MQTESFATLNGTDVLVWDDRFSKFWKTPNVLSLDDVRNKISELKPSKDNEYHQNLIANSGSFISYMDFENYYLKGNQGSSFLLTLFSWDKLKYIEHFNRTYNITDDNSCGLINAISNDIYRDIKAGQHNISFKAYHSDISTGDEASNYQYHIYSYILPRLKEYNYSDDYKNNVIDFDERVSDLNMYSRQLSVYSSFVNTMLDLHNDIDVSHFPDTSDLTDKKNELIRQRRVNFRQKIYNDIDDKVIDNLNFIGSDSNYEHYRMRDIRRFYTTNSIGVENVFRVQVLKKLETKVKLRIFVKKMFYSMDGVLVKYNSDASTRVYVPMYVEKNVDIRLFIDFMQRYFDHVSANGLLNNDDQENLDKIKFNESSLYKKQLNNVDNWKWQFTKIVTDSYDTSKLTLIEW